MLDPKNRATLSNGLRVAESATDYVDSFIYLVPFDSFPSSFSIPILLLFFWSASSLPYFWSLSQWLASGSFLSLYSPFRP